MPAFSFRHVKDLYPVFWSKTCELVRAIQSATKKEANGAAPKDENTSVVEISQWTSRATLDIIGVAGMGHDFKAIQDPDTEIMSTYRKIFQPTGQAQFLAVLSLVIPIWILRILPLQRNDDIRTAVATIRRVCHQLIQQKQRRLEQGEKGSEKDIISVALDSKAFSEDNLVDQMMTFLAAGHETTATAMVWAIYALCQNPEYQVRLREEIRAHLPSTNDESTSVTAETLDKLSFLHAVCNEVLRLYAPVSLTLREAANDTSIQGQFVPAGTKVIIVPKAVNVSKDLWGPDADKFNPDRWMGPGRANNGGAESNFGFLTFLHGPRSCIGTFLSASRCRFRIVTSSAQRVLGVALIEETYFAAQNLLKGENTDSEIINRAGFCQSRVRLPSRRTSRKIRNGNGGSRSGRQNTDRNNIENQGRSQNKDEGLGWLVVMYYLQQSRF